MTRVLEWLSVQEEPLEIGPTRQLTVDDIQDIPSIRTTYAAEVLIVHASSALRRIMALAYMLVWSWSKHVSAATQPGLEQARQVILLFDEVDAHLHPRWQRTIIPAILEVMNSLTTANEETVPVQIIAATHSPLVLASVETHFDEDRDRLFHLDIRDRQVHLDEIQWARQGDALNWLVSHSFGLRQGRSLEAERAIEADKAFMGRREGGTDAEAVAKRDSIHRELQRVLPGHDPFWPRWVVWVERQAAQQ